MKIGIVTQPLAANYGGILQNYALQVVLTKMGHTPITLRIGKKTYGHYLKRLIVHVIKKGIGRESNKPEIPFSFRKRQAGMERFIKSHINTTPLKVWFNIKDIERYSIDALIVGSDQVWRPNYNRHIEDMFLRFAIKNDIKKIAYAASFGTDQWLYTQDQTIYCKELISSFKAISVREKSGVKLCANYLEREDATWVLDPTMLLNKEDYSVLCENIPIPNEDFLFAYILDINRKTVNFITEMAKSRNLKLKIISAQDNTSHTDTVEMWLAMFRDASYVITDSFHGIVFCLLFQKEFNALKNHTRGSARFDSLIHAFDIEDRFISLEKCEGENNNVNSAINWDVHETKLDSFRKTSNAFLLKALM